MNLCHENKSFLVKMFYRTRDSEKNKRIYKVIAFYLDKTLSEHHQLRCSI